ncbi:MAG: c-type cytochrome [Pseudomonadota bacterium]
MRYVLIFVLGGLMLAGTVALAQDRGAGRKAAGMCRTCHGLDGYAKIPIAPHIGGEPAAYIEAQLRAFRSGERQHEMMTVVARSLSDEQIVDLAAWYAGHTAAATAEQPEAAPRSCTACHGMDGLSKAEDAPHLAGEANIYIDTQLKAFKRGKREHEIMSEIAAALDDEEIREIADYYAAIDLEITQVD